MRFLSRCLCVWSVSLQPWFAKESCNMQRRWKQRGATSIMLTRSTKQLANTGLPQWCRHIRIAADLQSVFLPSFTRRKRAQISRPSWGEKKPFSSLFANSALSWSMPIDSPSYTLSPGTTSFHMKATAICCESALRHQHNLEGGAGL